MQAVEKTNFIVHFDRIMVNAIHVNSGIFVGSNAQHGWSSHNKTNTSVGNISGDGNAFTRNLNLIMDNDGIDTPIDDRDLTVDARRMVQAS